MTAEPHYSYTTYADPAMAASFDAKRFGGPIGRLLLEDQEGVLLESLGAVNGRRILDVGTGTGRAAIALARRGATVTGLDASSQMLAVARTRARAEDLSIDFVEGDAHALVYADRSFDSTVCLRVLMHVPDWRRTVGELCRVTKGRLIFDYPALSSLASLHAAWRRAGAATGRQIEAYRVFRFNAIAHELDRHGFRVFATHKQFVLPIGFHKMIGSAPFTRRIERALAGAGLRRCAGSPVTVAAERCGS